MRFMASSSGRQGKRRRMAAAEGDPHVRVWSPTPMTTLRQSKGCVLFWNFFSAYLCVPLRLCGKQVVRAHLPQRRRGTQRYAEKNKTPPATLTNVTSRVRSVKVTATGGPMYYCPSCGNEITVELKYCNRCGANLTLPAMSPPTVLAPVRMTMPSIVLGLMILGGLGIIFGSATDLARSGIHPAAIVWMVLFSAAALFGCTALVIRFFTKMLTMQREVPPAQLPRPVMNEQRPIHHLQ